MFSVNFIQLPERGKKTNAIEPWVDKLLCGKRPLSGKPPVLTSGCRDCVWLFKIFGQEGLPPPHQLTWKCTDPCRKTTFLLASWPCCTSALVGGKVIPRRHTSRLVSTKQAPARSSREGAARPEPGGRVPCGCCEKLVVA